METPEIKALVEGLAHIACQSPHNPASSVPRKEFLEQVRQLHPTEQQQIFGLFLSLCKQWSEMRVDLRLEYANKQSLEIMKLPCIQGLEGAPYI